MRSLELLEPPRKVEGIEARVVGRTAFHTLVTDADDPDHPADLGTTRVELRSPMPTR